MEGFLALLVDPFFFLLFFFFYFVSFQLNAVMLMQISDIFFSLLQSEVMIFFALVLPVPETGSPGADSAPLHLQLSALQGELFHLCILTVPQLRSPTEDLKFFWAFTCVIIDNFILFLFHKPFNRVQLGNKKYFFIF